MHLLDQVLHLPGLPPHISGLSGPRDTLILVPQTEEAAVARRLFAKLYVKLEKDMDQEALILSTEGQRIAFPLLRAHFQFKRLILCGMTAWDLGLQSRLGRHIPVQLQGAFLLITEKPSVLETSAVDTKIAFWTAFQQGFQ